MLTPERAEELEAKRVRLLQELEDAGVAFGAPNVTIEVMGQLIARMKQILTEVKEIVKELES